MLKYCTILAPIVSFPHGDNGEEKMQLPPEHINFGMCDIKPDPDVDPEILIKPPTEGFELHIEYDYPDKNINYRPVCQGDDFDRNLETKRYPYPTEHVSMYHLRPTESFEYKSKTSERILIPDNGAHRPMWAAYGEYEYVPPSRYLHNLEHGAILFLYHPCADKEQVEVFKELARSCLWKHLISKWDVGLNSTYPFGIVAWRNATVLSNVISEDNQNFLVEFIKSKALMGGSREGRCWGNGGFTNQLIQHSKLVSGIMEHSV